jgi:insertion element IS1 protein InsB
LDQKKDAALPELSETLAEPDPDDPESTVLELDELWSFVLKKERKAWVWVAQSRQTRQIVAYVIGDRSERPCRQRLARFVRKALSFSKSWKMHEACLRLFLHRYNRDCLVSRC